MNVEITTTGEIMVRRRGSGGGGGELKSTEDGGWEVRVVRERQGWEERGGCEFSRVVRSRKTSSVAETDNDS